VNFGGRPPLYFGYSEPNPSALKFRITSRTRSSPVNATLALAADDPHQLPALVVIDLANPQPFRHRSSLSHQHPRGKPRRANLTCYGTSQG
jgi:hypothetical protein